MRDILLFAGAAILLLLIVRGWRSGGSVPENPPNDPWFQAQVVQPSADRPVIVKFGASWCGPCRMMESELDSLKSKLGSAIDIVKVDIDEREDLSDYYGIRGIPRTLVFLDGKVVADRTGLRKSDEMHALVKNLVR